ncbi:MAG: hypothetical protein CL960_02615 [Euryarchaeota archaeon]|jgi:2-oxoglutarate ferredoxin oxidoreductase subunit delta|nr:hypothetical protein [Euryarchaeota archaeon]|tara:strand:- start:2740 stop:3015 length:276 start_codon:yes stop_codon:yes gene_type:complete
MSGIAGPSELPAEARFLVEVNEVTCKGCAICVSVCPRGNLLLDKERLTPGGHNPVAYSWEGLEGTCTGCGLCYRVCPDAAIIAVWERELAT